MKKGVLMLIMIACFAAGFALLLNLGVKAESWSFWIALVVLPLSGFILGKANLFND
jgi:hypothetical protein